MYYEEKYEDGLWYCRDTPDGKWLEMGRYVLSEKLAAAQREVAELREALRAHDAEKAQAVCEISKRPFTIHGDQWHDAEKAGAQRDDRVECQECGFDFYIVPGARAVTCPSCNKEIFLVRAPTTPKPEATAPLLAPEGWRTNYICDRECEPRCVTFADGRVVRVIGDGYLEIERAPS